MAKLITELPKGSRVIDPFSLDESGNPIEWEVLDFNHANYPGDSVTLITTKAKLISQTAEAPSVLPWGYHESAVSKYCETDFYNALSSKLKKAILTTPLEVSQFASATGTRSAVTRNYNVFIVSAKEFGGLSGNYVSAQDASFSYAGKWDTAVNRAGSGLFRWVRNVGISDTKMFLQYFDGSTTITYNVTDPVEAEVWPTINIQNNIYVSDAVDANGAHTLLMYDHKYLVQDESDIKTIVHVPNGIKANVATAQMTSDNTPSGRAFASSVYAGSYAAWKAFNQIDDSEGFCSRNGDGNKGYLGYEFTQPKMILKYAIRSGTNNLKYLPKDWTFEGSDDGANWTVLDTQTGQLWTTANTEIEYMVSSPGTFKQYRLNWTDNAYGSATSAYTSMNEFKLYEQDTKPIWKTVAQAPVTKALFDQHGFSDYSLMDNAKIYELVSDTPEMLVWTEETGSPEKEFHMDAVPRAKVILQTVDTQISEFRFFSLLGTNGSVISDVDSIPALTSNHDQGYNVYSSDYNLSAYTVFGDDALSWSSAVNSNAWIMIELPNQKVIRGISILPTITSTGFAGMDKTPRINNWRLEGSNDGVNFTTIYQDVQTKVVKQNYYFENVLPFKYIRLYIIDAKAGPIGAQEIEMFFMEKAGAEDLRVIASGDSGVTWTGKQQVDVSNLDSVKTSGWSIEEFNSLTRQQLEALFPNKKARFGFYMNLEKSTDAVVVDTLSVGEDSYDLTPYIENIGIVFQVLNPMGPRYFVSRDDGATWKEVNADNLTSISDLPAGKNIRVKAVLSEQQDLQALSYSWA